MISDQESTPILLSNSHGSTPAVMESQLVLVVLPRQLVDGVIPIQQVADRKVLKESVLLLPSSMTKVVVLNVLLSTNVLVLVNANVTIHVNVTTNIGVLTALARNALFPMAKNAVVLVNANVMELANVISQEKEKHVNVSNVKVIHFVLDVVLVTVMEAVPVSLDSLMVSHPEKSVIVQQLVQTIVRTMEHVFVVFVIVMLNTNCSLIALAKNVQHLALQTKFVLAKEHVHADLVGSEKTVPKKQPAINRLVLNVFLIQTVVGVMVPMNVKTDSKLENVLTKILNATHVVSFYFSMLLNAQLVEIL